MENQNRTPAVTPAPTGWVVSPGFDLLFLANLYWIVLLWPGWLPSGGTELMTEFWVVYFLITPHRWITLFLVLLDPDRREGRSDRLFLGLAIGLGLFVLGVWGFTGTFTCLALLDYIWNGWHFASQHQGIVRMYARKVGGGPEWLERHLLRMFLFYILLRTAGWSTGWLETVQELRSWINQLDLLLLAVPISLLFVNLQGGSRLRLGKICYLLSLLGLYSTLLLGLRSDWRNLVIALTAAVSMFHATEYLAVVSHYSWRRSVVGSEGLFRRVASRWASWLMLYAVVLGILGVWINQPSVGWVELWLGINLWVAFLHYAYDGLIWKLRRPATAQALGVSP